MKFSDIPRFEPPNYQCDVAWTYLESTLHGWNRDFTVELEPDFQRGHVWTPEQQTAFLEFRMMGGIGGNDIYWNSDGWPRSVEPVVLVDGLQRITAVLGFLENRIPVFGHYRRDFKERLDMLRYRFRFHVNNLKSKADVLRWYLALNNGGTVHTPEEIKRVKELLEKETRQ